MCYGSTTLQNKKKETFYKVREREINLNRFSNILCPHPQWIACRSGDRFGRPGRSKLLLPGHCKGDGVGGGMQAWRGGRTADQHGSERAPERWAQG